MAENQKPKKGSSVFGGLLFLALAVFMFANNGEFAIALFGVVEVPLWIVGVISGLIGLGKLFGGNTEKKDDQNKTQ